MPTTIVKDKYGFIEETPEAMARPGKDDPIGRALEASGYVENYSKDGYRFSRFYWEKKVIVDIFKKETDGKDIKLKKQFCKANGMIYIPIEKGHGKFTAKELKKYLKQGGK
jgi:hypothetical protein